MNNVIIVAEISERNGWANIKTNEGKEISIMLSKCPKLAEQLKDAKPGIELTGKLVEKDGKSYLWDIDEKKSGSKSFPAADKSFQAALSASQAAGSMMALQKEVSYEKFETLANQIHAWILTKKSS